MSLTTGKGALRFETIDGEFVELLYSTPSAAANDAAAIRTAQLAGTRCAVTLGDGRTYILNDTGPQSFAVTSVVTS